MSTLDDLRNRIATALGVDRNRVLFTWGSDPVHPIAVSLAEHPGGEVRPLHEGETVVIVAAGVEWDGNVWKVKGAT